MLRVQKQEYSTATGLRFTASSSSRAGSPLCVRALRSGDDLETDPVARSCPVWASALSRACPCRVSRKTTNASLEPPFLGPSSSREGASNGRFESCLLCARGVPSEPCGFMGGASLAAGVVPHLFSGVAFGRDRGDGGATRKDSVNVSPPGA